MAVAANVKSNALHLPRLPETHIDIPAPALRALGYFTRGAPLS